MISFNIKKNNIQKISKCLICSSKESQVISNVYYKNKFIIFQTSYCKECLYIFRSRRPNIKWLEKAWKRREKIQTKKKISYINDIIEIKREQRYKKLFRFISNKIKFNNLLDVGCGPGTGLKHLIKLKKKIYGIEPDLSRAKIAKRNKINIIKGKITKEIRNKVDAKTKKAAEAEKKKAERQQLEQLLKTSNSINTTYYIGLFNKGQSYNAVKKQIDNKLANIKSRKNAANELKKQQEIAKKAKEEAKQKEEEARRKVMENQMYFNEQSQLEAQKAANEARKAKEEAARKVEEAKKMKEQKRVQDKKVIQSMIQKAGGISINGAAYLSKLNANTYNFDSIKKALIANIKTKKNAKKAINIAKQKENAAKQNIVRKNLELRKGLRRKVQRAQFKNDSNKRKLFNQINNTKTMTAKELQPKINKAIKELSLNGNLNETENKKKRQEVKKQLASYIAKTYPNMSKADRGKYIQRANLTEWRKGFLRGSQGMGANQALERIKGNIKRNMNAKKAQQKPPPPPKNKPPPPPKNKKANLKKLVNTTLKGRAGKNAARLKKNINEGVSEMTVKTRLAQLNKQTKYQTK